jgi:NDP-sugar pyrophosphorylase family protein
VKAFVLAAGQGTRLRPLTDDLPKPLVPVGDSTAFEGIVEQLRGAADARDNRLFSEIVTNAWHAKHRMVEAANASGVRVSVEDELLGTAGGVRRAFAGAEDVLVWNGDIVTELSASLARLCSAEHVSKALATLVVAEARGAGNVGVGADGRVVRLRKERFGDEVRAYDFLGIHRLGAEAFPALPDRGCLVGDVYLPLLARGARLDVYVHSARYYDVGTLADYAAANFDWLATHARADGNWVAPGAVSKRATGSIVGEFAVVGRVERSVVWPGTRRDEDLVGVIATPTTVVRY